jgi:GNAT superfamily N-acetyltransferase
LLRRATDQDIARIFEIRNGVSENRLSDPTKVTVDHVRWFIANPGIFLWEEDGQVAGFSAADPRNGSIWALFVDQPYEGRGIGQHLFARACTVLEEAGWARMWLTTDPGTRAETFYRLAGWQAVGHRGTELLFAKDIAAVPSDAGPHRH